MAAKVATDLKRMQRFYGGPSDTRIANYEAEIIELLKAGYLGDRDATATSATASGSSRHCATRRATLPGSAANDDDPGRVRPGANISGASSTAT